MNPTLSVVIVSWNTRDLLIKCLGALGACEGDLGPGSVETFVVDNASTDGSADAIRDQFPRIRVIESGENLGFARASNLALQQRKGRFALLLNPDAELQPGALSTLIRFMEQHPRVGAAGARTVDPDGTLQRSCFPFPTLGREFLRLFHIPGGSAGPLYPMAAWDPGRSRPVDVVQGSCMILRGTALDACGLLDEGYFMYSEEVDLCRRLKSASWEVHWVPAAVVIHHGGSSTEQVARPMFVRLYESKVRYFRQQQGGGSAAMYKLILTAAALTRIALTPLTVFRSETERGRDIELARRYLDLLPRIPGL
jgi:GT2 family glycosyltransferase